MQGIGRQRDPLSERDGRMRRGTKEPVCNKDCFHCPYPDCVADDTMDLEDYREARERDLDLRRTPEQKKLAAKQKAYREANREEIAAYQKAYYEANREELSAYKKAYYEANREEIAAYKKAYREARRWAGLSQVVVAEALGISQPTYSMWETGALPSDYDRVMGTIARLARCSVEMLETACVASLQKRAAFR